MCLFQVLPPLRKAEKEHFSSDFNSIEVEEGPGEHKFSHAKDGYAQSYTRTALEYNRELLGTGLRYGNEVVLFHQLSKKLVTPHFSSGGSTAGSRLLELNGSLPPEGPSQCLCVITPFDNKTRYGDLVDVSKPLKVQFSEDGEFSYCLNLDPQSGLINISVEKASWVLGHYDTYEPDGQKVIRYGSIVTVRNRKLGISLTAAPIYDKPYDFNPDLAAQKEESLRGGDANLPSIFANTYKIALTYEPKDYNRLWVFEREDKFVGGAVQKGDSFWLKQAATMRYLSPDGSLSAEKTEGNCLRFLEQESEEGDFRVQHHELIQLLAPSDEVLVPGCESSPRFLWSALFSKQLQQQEDRRYELYQPVGFARTGAEERDVDFEVTSPSPGAVANTFVTLLCMRKRITDFRLFFRRVESFAEAAVTSPSPSHWILPDATIQSQRVWFEEFSVYLSKHPNAEIAQNSLWAIGFFFDISEALYQYRKKSTPDYSQFVYTGLDPEVEAKCYELFGNNEQFKGIVNRLEREIVEFAMKSNAFISARFFENPLLAVFLRENNAKLLSNMLRYALENFVPDFVEFSDYCFFYQGLMCVENQDLSEKIDKIYTLAGLMSTAEGVLDTDAFEMLKFTTADGSLAPIAIFNNNPDAPGMNAFGQDIPFLPKRRITPAFMQGLEVAKGTIYLINSVCRVAKRGAGTLAEDLSISPEFITRCIDNSAINIAFRVELVRLYINLFLRGDRDHNSITEKMKYMCFMDSDLSVPPQSDSSPYATYSASELIKSAIRSEFDFWLATQPNDILTMVTNDPMAPIEKSAIMLSYIQTHILAVKYLIEWKHVNDQFVFCIEKAIIATLFAFKTVSTQSVGLEHWSTQMIQFIYDNKKTLETETVQSVTVSEGEIERQIYNVIRDLLTVYQLISQRSHMKNIAQTFDRLSKEPEWKQAQGLATSLTDAKVHSFYQSMINPLTKARTVAQYITDFLPPAQSQPGDSTDPLLSAAGENPVASATISRSVLEKQWEMKDFFLSLLLTAGDQRNTVSFTKHAKVILELLEESASPEKAFTDKLKNALFVKEGSMESIQSIVGAFKTCKLELKQLLAKTDPDSLQSLKTIAEGMEAFCDFLTDLRTKSTSKSAYLKILGLFVGSEMKTLMSELWELNSLLDRNQHSDKEISVRLKTLTLVVSQLFAEADESLSATMFRMMKSSNFYYDFPEYIEMIRNFGLLRDILPHISDLLLKFMVGALFEQPERSKRIGDSIETVIYDQGKPVKISQELLANALIRTLDSHLASENRNLTAISVSFSILSRLIRESPPILSNVVYILTREKMASLRLFETGRFDILISLLEYFRAAFMTEDLIIYDVDMAPWFQFLLESVRKLTEIDVGEFVFEVENGVLVLQENSQLSSRHKSNRNRNSSYSDKTSLLQLIFSYDRSGRKTGLCAFAYEVLFSMMSDSEDGVGRVGDIFKTLFQVYDKLDDMRVFPLKTMIHQTINAWVAVRTDKHILEEDERVNEWIESYRGVLEAPPSRPELQGDSMQFSSSAFQMLDVFEQDLSSFLSNFSRIKIVTERTSSLHLLQDHFKEELGQRGDDFDQKFESMSKATKEVFTVGNNPQIDLELKGNIIKDLDPQKRTKLSGIVWRSGLLEQTIQSVIWSADAVVRETALRLLNSIIYSQNREFLRSVLTYLSGRLRYFQFFSAFQRQKTTFIHYMAQFDPSNTRSLAYKEVSKSAKFLIQFLTFVQIACSGNFKEFQAFMRAQMEEGSTSNLNLVGDIRDLLVVLGSQFGDAGMPDEVILTLTRTALQALRETTSGPNVENQQVIGRFSDVYVAINSLISFCQKNVPADINATKWDACDLHRDVLRLLVALQEGHETDTTYELEDMFEGLDFTTMVTGLETIYRNHLLAYKNDIKVSAAPPLIMKLFDVGVLQMAVLQHIYIRSKERGGMWQGNQVSKIESLLVPEESLLFYVRYVGSVEVLWNDRIYDAVFPIPTKAKFLTRQSQIELIQNIKRGSPQEKVDDFISKRRACVEEMTHQQTLSKWMCLKAISSRWREYSVASFAVLMLINTLLLLQLENNEGTRIYLSTWAHILLYSLGAVQIATQVLFRTMYWVEFWHTLRHPLFRNEEVWDTQAKYAIAENNSRLMIYTYEQLKTAKLTAAKVSEMVQTNADTKLKVISQKQIIGAAEAAMKQTTVSGDPLDLPTVARLLWAILYTGLCAEAVLFSPQVYPLLLLDAVNLSGSLATLLKAVTQNGKQLILIAFFSLGIVYVFSMWAYFSFYTYYKNDANLYCETLLDCFFSTVNVGVRSGAIGDPMDPYDLDTYYPRMTFDFLFFVIVIVILLNIVFGIIIDTFGQLRDDRNEMEKDIENVCFICGEERSNIDLHGEKWNQHIGIVHSPFAYLAFIIHVEEKPASECSGLEKFVKEQLAKSFSTFMPTTSQALMKEREEDNSA